MFWGDRFAMFTDPFGHSWQVGAPKGHIPPVNGGG